MFIKDGKRFNIEASATYEDVTYPNFKDSSLQEKFGITWIADPQPPEDIVDEFNNHNDWYYVQEIDEFPYCLWIKKEAETIYKQELEKAREKRAAAYKERSDVLAFKVLRDEATKEQYIAEVAAIKAEFPDPVMPEEV